MARINEEAEVAALTRKISLLGEKRVEYEALIRNAEKMVDLLREAIVDAEDRIVLLGRGKAAGA